MARKQNKRLSDNDVERATARAIRSLGWLVPDTEAAVESSEERGDDEHQGLPPALADPFAALDPARHPSVPVLKDPSSTTSMDASEELARAAREATGEISSEVEEAMKGDRDTAERLADERKSGS